MGIFDGYLFCTDMDGTLTVGGSLSKENAQAIREFQQEGGIFVVSTGRAPHYIRQYAPDYVPNGPIIASNGTVICDVASDTVLFESHLDASIEEAMEYVVQHYPRLINMHLTYSMEETSARYYPSEGRSIREFMDSVSKPWYKVIFVVPQDESLQVRERLEQIFGERWNFNRSWPEGIELIPKNSGKGFCIDQLRDILGERARVVVAAGDFENDISMLEHADIAYAVENALDSVKNVADRVTVTNTEHAICAIIEELRSECDTIKNKQWRGHYE